jgi:hypothetical protein
MLNYTSSVHVKKGSMVWHFISKRSVHSAQLLPASPRFRQIKAMHIVTALSEQLVRVEAVLSSAH